MNLHNVCGRTGATEGPPIVLHNDTPLNLDSMREMKMDILKRLAAEILKYKVYPISEKYKDVAKAVIANHPCLKEKGSVGGFCGWKVSLQ